MVQSNRLRLHTLASSAKINKKKYSIKRYIHFDNKISFEKIEKDVRNPCWVSKHGFYPFIHFKMKFFKYNKKKRERKEKVRDIYYASHIDSYIYKFYGDMLNEYYNKVARDFGIYDVATAYRSKLKGKSNIHFAKEVIDFIKIHKKAFIYVADFTKFFDNLDHKYIKQKLQYVLNVDTLPDDYYAVFKSITRFSYIEKKDINEEIKNKYPEEADRKNLKRFFSEREFREFKRGKIKIHKEKFGIPQGAGISSVCSNIYLLDFDKQINDYVKSLNGLYRRYCDDLVIVIPFDKNVQDYDFDALINYVDTVRGQIPGLKIQKDKTDKFIYREDKILNFTFKPTHLDYLGFTFDGINVKIREKSLFKFYSRAYRKVRQSNLVTKKYGQKAYRKGLYQNYTHLGKYRRGHGNFLTYLSRAQIIFDNESETKNLMEKQVENHWRYIIKRLKNPN